MSLSMLRLGMEHQYSRLSWSEKLDLNLDNRSTDFMPWCHGPLAASAN